MLISTEEIKALKIFQYGICPAVEAINASHEGVARCVEDSQLTAHFTGGGNDISHMDELMERILTTTRELSMSGLEIAQRLRSVIVQNIADDVET